MDQLIVFLVGLIIVVVIFLVCREIVCWYWKINESKEILTNIKNSLNEINNKIDTICKSNKTE